MEIERLGENKIRCALSEEEIREMEVDAGRFTRTATGTEPI